MNTYDGALKDLSKLLVAVEPFGEHVVLAGGFAAWLYRFVGRSPPAPSADQTPAIWAGRAKGKPQA